MMSAFDNGLHEMIQDNDPVQKDGFTNVTMCRIMRYYTLLLTNDELYSKYMELSYLHNRALMSSTHPDSGVDLYVPDVMLHLTTTSKRNISTHECSQPKWYTMT